MPESDKNGEQAIRERAYFIWEREGCPEGRAKDHWHAAMIGFQSERSRDDEPMEDEEKVLAGRADANIPALLTKDVRGG